MKATVIFSEGLRDYDFGEGHPYRGDRYDGFISLFNEKLEHNPSFSVMEPEYATDDDLLLVHDREYVDFVQAASKGVVAPNWPRFASGDNLSPGTGSLPLGIDKAARLIAGTSKLAAELVWKKECDVAIGIGGGLHHAKPRYGEGFCIYNDVAICACHLIKRFGAERILILDSDAHAGNGTCEMFYEESRVLLVDLHQDPATLYPGVGFANEIGTGLGKGFTVNIPMPPLASDQAYEYALREIFIPLATEFRPQVIIRNGGCDPHFADGLTSLGVTLKGLNMIGGFVREAASLCECGVVDLVTSGYNPRVLSQGWLALISGVTGVDVELEDLPYPKWLAESNQLVETQRVIEECKQYLKPYWKSLSKEEPR